MKLRDLLKDDAAASAGAGEIDVTGVALDSRQVKRGDLFFALAGAKTDGAKFIDQAIANGAAVIAAASASLRFMKVGGIR